MKGSALYQMPLVLGDFHWRAAVEQIVLHRYTEMIFVLTFLYLSSLTLRLFFPVPLGVFSDLQTK